MKYRLAICTLVSSVALLACGDDSDSRATLGGGDGGSGGAVSTGGSSSDGGAGGGGGEETTTWEVAEAWTIEMTSVGAHPTDPVSLIETAPDGSLYIVSGFSSVWSLFRLQDDGTVAAGTWPHEVTVRIMHPSFHGIARPGLVARADGGAAITGTGEFDGWETEQIATDGSVMASDEFITGSGALPGGAVLDDAGNHVIYGIPGQNVGTIDDCYVARYDAAGDLIDDASVNVSAGTTPAFTNCASAVARGTEVIVAGRMESAQSSANIGLASVALDGTVSVLAENVGAVTVIENAVDLDVLDDGMLVVGISGGRTLQGNQGHLVVDGDGTVAHRSTERTGVARLAVLHDHQLVAVASTSGDDGNLTVEIERVTTAGLSSVATVVIAGSGPHAFVDRVATHGDEIYVSWFSDVEHLSRLTVTAR